MALSEYDKINLSGQQQANIQALTNQYKQIYDQAMAGGGVSPEAQAKLDRIHSTAESIRASGGNYSGGVEGTDYIPLEKELEPDKAPQAPTLRGPTSQESYVNSLYDAQREAALASLKKAYENNKATLDAQAEKIPAIYQDARNTTAAQSEQNRANFNEYAAASGLNSGAGGQAQLAMTNQLLGSLSGIDRSEAEAKNDLETERTRLAVNYENAIAQAVADGDLQRAQALYQEAVRVDEGLVATSLNQANMDLNYWSAGSALYQQQLAQQLALQQSKAQTLGAYGDFSAYADLGYSQEQIDQMFKVWAAQNPLLAAALGRGVYGYGYSYGGGSKGGGSGSSGDGTPLKDDSKYPDTTKPSDLAEGWMNDQYGNVTKVTVTDMKTGITTMRPLDQVQQKVKTGQITEVKQGGKIRYVENYIKPAKKPNESSTLGVTTVWRE